MVSSNNTEKLAFETSSTERYKFFSAWEQKYLSCTKLKLWACTGSFSKSSDF